MEMVSWNNLPTELVPLITERLDSHVDHIRVRSLCQSWRAFIPPPEKSPVLPRMLSFPSDDTDDRVLIAYMLYQSTVYRIEEPEDSPNNNGSWLMMASDRNPDGRLCLLNPFTMRPLENVPEEVFPRIFNFQNLRVSEVCKCFTLKWTGYIRNNDNNGNANQEADDLENAIDGELEEYKVEVSADFDTNNSFMALSEARLCAVTIDDEYWSLVSRQSQHHDIARYNGKFYTVDRQGMVTVTDDFDYESLVIPPVPPFLGEWYLLKSCSDLFLVGRDFRLCQDQVYFDVSTDRFNKRPDFANNVFVDFKVYVLNDTEQNPANQEWEEVEDLADYVFFVSRNYSFSIFASDFICEGNHIIYVDEVKDPLANFRAEYCQQYGPIYEVGGILGDTKVGVYNFERGVCVPLTSFPEFYQMFWPPPAWLRA